MSNGRTTPNKLTTLNNKFDPNKPNSWIRDNTNSIEPESTLPPTTINPPPQSSDSVFTADPVSIPQPRNTIFNKQNKKIPNTDVFQGENNERTKLIKLIDDTIQKFNVLNNYDIYANNCFYLNYDDKVIKNNGNFKWTNFLKKNKIKAEDVDEYQPNRFGISFNKYFSNKINESFDDETKKQEFIKDCIDYFIKIVMNFNSLEGIIEVLKYLKEELNKNTLILNINDIETKIKLIKTHTDAYHDTKEHAIETQEYEKLLNVENKIKQIIKEKINKKDDDIVVINFIVNLNLNFKTILNIITKNMQKKSGGRKTQQKRRRIKNKTKKGGKTTKRKRITTKK